MSRLPLKTLAGDIRGYITYLLEPDSQKTDRLLDTLSRDPFCARLIQDLKALQFDIRYRYGGSSGTYHPGAVYQDTDDRHAFEHAFKAAIRRGDMRCRFTLATRFGRAINMHYFIHELIHFYQDMAGLFMTPRLHAGRMPVTLDGRSTIMLHLFCEAMAETEAICASWRLKENGYPLPWRGALLSWDWSALARAYAKDLENGVNERSAALNTLTRWYKSRLKSYYERRGLAQYKANLRFYMKHAGIKSLSETGPFLRTLTPADIQNMLPESYDLKPHITAAHICTEIKSRRVCAALKAHERRTGAARSGHISDIDRGSPVYLLTVDS